MPSSPTSPRPRRPRRTRSSAIGRRCEKLGTGTNFNSPPRSSRGRDREIGACPQFRAMTRRRAKIRTLAVTGGTGFVGSHLLRLALEQGYDLRALTRGWKPPEDEVAWVDGALDRPETLIKLAAGADAVIHIAGA